MTAGLSGCGRVDRLAVDDDRQAEDAVGLGQARGEHVEVDPQVVGVEPRVPLGVLEEVVLALGHHRAVAQHEAAVALAHAEVTTLAVVASSCRHLGDVGDALPLHPGRHRSLAGGAEVVGVGQEGVAVAALAQRVEQPGGLQRDVDVAVARRAPLQRRVLRPLDRAEVVGAQLGFHVLQEVERQPVDGQARVAPEDLERLLAGAEGVHQHQRRLHPVPTAQRQHLAGDDVEEAEPVAHRQGRLRPADSHARAEATVELDHHRAPECRGHGVPRRAARRRGAARR